MRWRISCLQSTERPQRRQTYAHNRAHDCAHGRARVHACDCDRLECCTSFFRSLVLDRVQFLGHHARSRGGEESCH